MKSILFFFATLILAFPADHLSQVAANPDCAIAGTVIDARSGNPVRHAALALELKGEEVSTVADDSGRFRFDHLEAGKYRLYASAPGYVRAGLNQHGTFFTGVVTGSGLDSEHITFRLRPQALIHGRVTDQNGEPVRNAAVHLFAVFKNADQRPSMQAQMQTNDLGEYRFAHLLAGKYFVAVEAQPWYAQTGFSYSPVEAENATVGGLSPLPRGKPDGALDVVYPVTFFPGVTDEGSANEIRLSEGETAEASIPVRAVPAVHLRLTNMPEDKSAPPNISVLQKVFGTFPVGLAVQTMEISPGEFEIAGLPPGDLTFAINRGNAGQNERTIEANVSGDGTLDASKPLPSAMVSGRVILPEASEPIGDAVIMLLKDGNPATSARLNKDGSFALGALPAGAYRIAANFLGEPKYIQKISVSGAKVSGRELFITGSNDINLTVVMSHGFGTISGVAMLNSRTVEGVMVLLVPDSGINLDEDARMDQSDSDGSFQLGGIIPGKYRLLAIQGGWSLDWRIPTVLKPYLEKAQSLEIAPSDSKKITVEVQRVIVPRGRLTND